MLTLLLAVALVSGDVIHDFDRAGEGVISMATFREDDVRVGKPVTDAVRLRAEVSRLRPGR